MIPCNACARQVIPTKLFSWPWFVQWLLLTWIGVIFYLVYYLSKTPRVCPACNLDVYDGFIRHSSQTWASGIVITENLPEASSLDR